jgi:hypothetical protein
VALVIRVDVEQKVMDLIAQSRGLGEGRFPFCHQEVKHSSHILSRDARQRLRLIAHELGDGMRV